MPSAAPCWFRVCFHVLFPDSFVAVESGPLCVAPLGIENPLAVLVAVLVLELVSVSPVFRWDMSLAAAVVLVTGLWAIILLVVLVAWLCLAGLVGGLVIGQLLVGLEVGLWLAVLVGGLVIGLRLAVLVSRLRLVGLVVGL